MFLYDMHVATESGDSKAMRNALFELGFKDDNLTHRGLIFDEETAKHYVTCPLIDVHASKKVSDHPELRGLELEVDKLMKSTGSVGYWHSECILADAHLEDTVAFAYRPFPFRKLTSCPRSEPKVWDIHIACKENTVPADLRTELVNIGMYYLSRKKKLQDGSEAEFAVYTMQGVNNLAEGRKMYTALTDWLVAAHAPPCDIKLELTTAMELYGSPRAVPPTVDYIDWI